MHPVATPPLLCWLCGAGFLSWQALYRHTRAAHADYAEYRKHLFWVAQKRGFLPLLPWQKRHMLANLAFFQCFSIPESGLAMWQAAHNTDYYITKYGTKPLEQLQNLIAQFALGLRRLELEEQQERDAEDAVVLKNPQAYKQRARRVTLRLAMAATRRRGLHAARWPCLFAQELMSERHIIPETSTSAVWHSCAIHVYVSRTAKKISCLRLPTRLAKASRTYLPSASLQRRTRLRQRHYAMLLNCLKL